MKHRKNKPSRRVSRDAILKHLRDLILTGSRKAGDRLPAQAEVVQKFGSSPLTVKRAYRQLVAQGFARAVPKIGTFVADHPPHLFRYALAFHDHPTTPAPTPPDSPANLLGVWSRFYQALSLAAARLNRIGPRRVSVYYDCNGHSDSEGFQQLLRDVSAQTLAGVMFPMPPHDPLGSAIMNLDIPCVAASTPAEYPVPVVGYDPLEFMARAMDVVRERGRRRVALLTTHGAPAGFWPKLAQIIESRGLISPPFWTQAVLPQEPFWIGRAVHALLHSYPGERPDALVVGDDHMVEPLANVLLELGVRVPDDLMVVAHWNFPLAYEHPVPIQLLGWDAGELLERWMRTIDTQRRGEPVEPRSTLPVRLGSELVTSYEPSPFGGGEDRGTVKAHPSQES